MKIEQNAFPSSNQPVDQPTANRLKATLRWFLSFSFFLALFAVLITLNGYGFNRFSGAEQKQAAISAPTATPTPSIEPAVLPSGAAGHVASNQAPAPTQSATPR